MKSFSLISALSLLAMAASAQPSVAGIFGHGHHGGHHGGHHYGGHHYGGHHHHYGGHHYAGHYGGHYGHHSGIHLSFGLGHGYYGHNHHYPSYSYRSYYPRYYSYYPRSYSYSYPRYSSYGYQSCYTPSIVSPQILTQPNYAPIQPAPEADPQRKVDPPPQPIPGGASADSKPAVRSNGLLQFTVLRRSNKVHAEQQTASEPKSVSDNTTPDDQLGPQLTVPKTHTLRSDEEIPWVVE